MHHRRGLSNKETPLTLLFPEENCARVRGLSDGVHGGIVTSRHLEARDAEQAVLGAILLDNSALDRVGEFLTLEDFFMPRHRNVFSAMLSLSKESKPVDTITLATVLEQKKLLEKVGGMEYLSSLDQISATAVNVDHHAKIVRELADVRRPDHFLYGGGGKGPIRGL